LAQGQSAVLDFDYSVTAPNQNNRFGVTKAGVVLWGNALPTLAVREGTSWRTHPYVPFGEAFYSVAAPWKIKLDMPAAVEASVTGNEEVQIANGRRVVTATTSAARDALVAAGVDMVRGSKTVDGTKVNVLMPRADSKKLETTLAAATDHVGFMNRTYGPYGEKELDIVGASGFIAGGMEYPQATIVNTGIPQNDINHVIAHENAHQWFYGIVGNDSYVEPWLDESLTDDAARRWTPSDPSVHRDGLSMPEMPEAGAPPSFITSPISRMVPPGTKSFQDAGALYYFQRAYMHGPKVLAELRQHIGADAYDAGMRAYVSEFRNGIATTADFVRVMSTAAKTDLTPWLAERKIVVNPPGRDDALDPNGPPVPD
jgi:hypothetical protein